MTDECISLNKQMGTGLDAKNWKFIYHAVHAILKALYKCQRGGARFVGKPKKQVLFALKVVELQHKIFDTSFFNHKIVQQICIITLNLMWYCAPYMMMP